MGAVLEFCLIYLNISKKYHYPNTLYFFDSFEGLPQPSIKDGRDAKIFANGESKGDLKSINKVKAEEGYIKELLFEKLEIDPTKVYGYHTLKLD